MSAVGGEAGSKARKRLSPGNPERSLKTGFSRADITTMANVLSFDLTQTIDEGATVITPCVDGVLLTSLVEQFEKHHGMTDPAGGYGGLIPEFYQYGPLSEYFLGKRAEPLFSSNPGRIYLLGCECGEVGCWPLTAQVSIRGQQVLWHAFEQPYRFARDYTAFGPFEFDRLQYLYAVKDLPY